MLQSTNPAARLFNEAWQEFEAGNLSIAIEKAEHSLEIWLEIGTEMNAAIGYWQVGRFKAFAGDLAGARAAHESCVESLGKVSDAPTWMRASAAELGARVLSDQPASDAYRERYLAAEALIAQIDDQENHDHIAGQFADLPKPL